MTKRILVTGASGFVGRAVIERLRAVPEVLVVGAYRQPPTHSNAHEAVLAGDLGPDTDWSAALQGCDAVVHCAARVHVMHEAGSPESLALFRRINVEGSEHLARQAATAGVHRLVFVSSIKVNGESTTGAAPYRHDDTPHPQDAYGVSKWEAEQAMWKVSKDTGLEVAVVRPPLVYGPGVKANFLRLMQAVHRRRPLPFGALHNRRSMVYVANLADLLARCVLDSRAAGETFLASDGQDLSTRDLIEYLAAALDVPPRLLSVPPSLMWFGARLLGKKDLADRLLGSLQVDIGHTRAALDWTPPHPAATGMRATARAWLAHPDSN